MKQPPIIVIVNKKPYTFSANDTEVIRSIPSADRQQLITLLEAIKQQENQSQASVQQAAAMASATSTLASTAAGAGNSPIPQAMNRERLHNGDADALMAQLIMEENLNKKPTLTKRSIYKWTAIVALIVFVLVLIL